MHWYHKKAEPAQSVFEFLLSVDGSAGEGGLPRRCHHFSCGHTAAAEQKLIAGYQTEYSGLKFGMFYVGEFLHAFTVSAITAALFFGGWQVPYLTAEGWQLPGLALVPVAGWLVTVMQVGAFDTFGTTRPHQFWEIQTITRAGHDPSTGQLPMANPAAGIDTPAASLLTPPSRLDRLRAEMELLGFPVSGHPLELYPNIAWDTYVPITRLGDHVGQTVTTCGLIVQDRVHCQVTGGLMKFMTIADRTGLVETDLFAETYKSYGLATVRYPLLQITARVEPYENGNGYSLRVLQAGKPRIRHTAVPHPA